MQYTYKATNPQGKIMTGTQDAESEGVVVSALQAQGLIPIRVGPANQNAPSVRYRQPTDWSLFARQPMGSDILRFTQDLATLLSAGLPLDRSLQIVLETADKKPVRAMVEDILRDVNEGLYFSDALAKHPRSFSEFYIHMVRSGEAGGVLEHVLERVAHFLETSHELKNYVISALIYPLFVLTIGGASIIILLTFVVPKFAVIFNDLGQTIPLATRALLGLAGFLRSFAVPLLGALLLSLIGIQRYSQSKNGRLRIDGWRLKWPIIGGLTRTLETARFTRTLGTLIGSGVAILDSLTMARNVMGNQVIAQALDKIHARVKEGDHLADPLAHSGHFPMLAIQMVRVGEETGQLDRMLLKVSDIYDKKGRQNIKRLINLLEPVMILVMGLVVGFIVIAMLMAIFSMNELPF